MISNSDSVQPATTAKNGAGNVAAATDSATTRRSAGGVRGIRTSLTALVLTGLVPVLVFAGIVLHLFTKQHQEGVQQRLVGIAQATVVAIDRELTHHIDVLETIAQSELLDRGDLAAYHAALRALHAQEGWLALALHDATNARQILNTAAPFGAELPDAIDPASLRDVAQSGRSRIVGITLRGTMLSEPFVLLRVPVVRDGSVPLVLSAAMPPTALNAIVARQRVPAGSVVAVLDSRMHIAGRNRAQDQFIATRATPSLTERIEAAESGMFLALNKEGDPVYTIFSRSTVTGWAVVIGIPAVIIDGPLQRTMLMLGGIGLALLAGGIALAVFVGRTIARRQRAEAYLGAARAALAAQERAALVAAKEAAENETLAKDRSLKVAEAQLHQSQKLEVIGQLTGGIAHDFNNLLLVVMANAEMLTEASVPPDDTREAARLIQLAAERGSELTHRLLAFARRQALQPVSFDLNRMVDDMGEMLKRTLGGNVEIRMNLAVDLHPALADPAQVESAILNLAINARDAMPSGGRLVIETANTELDADYAEVHADVTCGSYVLVAVSDSGTGMTPEVAARAFEPFFTTKEVGKGSGLGLSMVYGFLKQSGGQVKIYSEPTEGTTVKLYLPRAAVGGEPTQKRSGDVRDGGSETILVVEDDPMVRASVVAQLRSLGYAVLEADSGAAALEALGRVASRVDLLLTDVVMPGGINGRQLADEVRSLYPEMRILFTSGYTEHAIVAHGKIDDGAAFLQKPYRKAELAQKLRLVLGRDE